MSTPALEVTAPTLRCDERRHPLAAFTLHLLVLSLVVRSCWV
ncbi:MAG: hypothetical protein AB2A00_05500 [Myxococcota bacterium]